MSNESNKARTAPRAHERVKAARKPDRPRVGAYISDLFDDFFEIHGDRLFGDDAAMLCGIAAFEGRPVTVAGSVKGTDLDSNIARNFGMASPDGYRKFQRAIKQAEKFGRPVVTFIDTPGASPTATAEERGQGEAIARCLFELSGLKTPVIAVFTGEGGSGGALALGLADSVIMLENAIYSVLSPEGFASILWKDASRAEEAAEVMKLTAEDLRGFGMADAIVREPHGGAGANRPALMRALRPVLRRALNELCALDTETLLAQRYKKYRKF
ncbi:MAG: acetyl-CoA carboxylase carboxyl transferase subunit alpha [Oscillospiraceae bacterium]|jgi:acetyl-CoA carboxylase carboxyl transferase subunit alpha|nr:acetyl-CoA carboxylase carboxyl transferase subunit alpha [Oscillospiraceae bacterium]